MLVGNVVPVCLSVYSSVHQLDHTDSFQAVSWSFVKFGVDASENNQAAAIWFPL